MFSRLVKLVLFVALPGGLALGSSPLRGQEPPAPILEYHAPQTMAPANLPQQVVTPRSGVVLAAHEAVVSPSTPARAQPEDADPRLLRRPTAVPERSNRTAAGSRAPISLPQLKPLGTAGAGLAIVVGLFLICMWLLRQSGPRPMQPLPPDAVAVLGRLPLGPRHFAQLVRLGNKLVLVSVTPDGATSLGEVTDPVEVQRLLGLCLSHDKHSSSAEFQKVLRQLAREPAEGFLGKETSATYVAGRR